jgi:hypothetical protein
MAYTDIDKSDDYFNTVTYTGDGNSNRSVTGVGFQPDWTWIKRRNTTGNHPLLDVVRGPTNWLYANLTEGEDSASYTDNAAFISDGFKPDNAGSTNASGSTYVAWSWLADNTSGSSNTDGDIASTVSVNTTSGFSIVTYDGPASGSGNKTIGHGLGVAPSVIMVKSLNLGTRNWDVYHKSLGYNASLILNENNSTRSGAFGAEPTSTIFTATKTYTWDTNIDYVAYCFAEIKGFSKFGNYAGNGSSEGPFVYTGFKPAYVMQKASTRSGSWAIYDNGRNQFNGAGKRLFADTDGSESDGEVTDLLSNGFKLRNTGSGQNENGQTYIYMAFAENPFVTSTGIPGLAR